MPLLTMNVNTSGWREKIEIHRGEILSFHSFCDDHYQIAYLLAAHKTIVIYRWVYTFILCIGIGTVDLYLMMDPGR